ncbi:MAG: ATP synthase F0 subunit B [Bacteroidetes bacterium]|jgi:F-type H+-transporting ATPase subunit b|nr:ATP synthase F0 subunit B [Bacteroidota bacterium]|tara:strand:- start:81 stop:575 length:495 start_codon:yes stop_codon:yes gene_type:complete
MSLINPGFGLVIWMTIAFGILLWVLAKFAWPAIMTSLKEREKSIEDALLSAEKAREAMEELKLGNEELINEAKDERDSILKEARALKEKMIHDAKEKAQTTADSIVENAKDRIESEKEAALVEIKNTIATYSIDIAEKILREELKDKERQTAYAEKLLKETNLN